MSEPRAARKPAPNGVAVVTAGLVLGVGLGLGAYFLEIRGIGLQGELQRGRAAELLLLLGLVVAVAGTAFFAVAGAMRQPRSSSSGYRWLTHRALELDYTDPGALHEFDAAPELSALVGMLMAEKTQVRQLSDRLDSLSGEMNGLVAGMQRSLEDRGQLRAEGLSETGLQVTACWNRLVDELRCAQEATRLATTRAAAGESPASDGVVRRLESLEAELQQLRAGLDRRPSAVAAPPPVVAPPPSAAGPSAAPRFSVVGPEFPAARPEFAAAGSAPPRFEDVQFPHFVGRPVEPISDRVEVLYETRDGDEPVDLPASALLFEAEDEMQGEPVVDLRTLGAVELRE